MTFRRFKTLAPTVSNLMLDWVERSVVLIIFAYFVVRMAPRLAQLITVQMDHPELILPAAGISAQAALLIVSELLSVILILARRPSPSLSSYPFDWALCFYSYRHIVRPGITGWAQVQQGNVARPELVQYKLHFDFYYIKNFSPWLDAVIAAMTIRTILTGFGSR